MPRERIGCKPLCWGAALLVGLGVVIAVGADRVPAGPARGISLAREATRAPSGEYLRIATFNIARGRGRDHRLDLERTAQSLFDFDLIGLNEVGGPWPWEPRGQSDELADILGLGSLYAPAERRWWHDSLGNAVLSRSPVRAWNRQQLPGTQAKGYKGLLELRLDCRGRIVHVLVTHIDRRAERAGQLATVIERFGELPAPAVLMGDLNTKSDDPDLRRLLSTAGVTEVLGTSGDLHWPDRIDWIFVRGMRVRASGVIDRGASDHPCVWAELDL